MTARSRLGSSVSAGTRYGTPASRILRFARTKRWAIVESGTRNARAISGRLQPAEQPQRQGDLRLGGQRRMTAGEDQPQPVTADYSRPSNSHRFVNGHGVADTQLTRIGTGSSTPGCSACRTRPVGTEPIG